MSILAGLGLWSWLKETTSGIRLMFCWPIEQPEIHQPDSRSNCDILQLFLSSFRSCLRNDRTSSCLTSRREIYSTAPLEHNHGSWACLPRFQLFIDVFNSFSAVYEAPRGLSVNSAVSSALCFRLAACELCQRPLVWQMENLRLRFTVSVCLRNEISRQGNFTQTGYFWNKQSN